MAARNERISVRPTDIAEYDQCRRSGEVFASRAPRRHQHARLTRAALRNIHLDQRRCSGWVESAQFPRMVWSEFKRETTATPSELT